MRALIAGDFHVPYHDKQAVQAVLRFAKNFKPTHVVIHGDLVDFEAFSRFLKDPREVADPQEELDAARKLLRSFRQAAPKARLIFGIGNHEHRLQSYLLKSAPALISLRSINLAELLGLDQWTVVLHESFVKLGNLITQHGVSYGPTTDRKNIARFGGFNVAQGHSHRLKQTFVRSLHGVHSVVETGCLCGLEPKYTAHPDWQHGFATFDNGHLRVHVIENGEIRS